MSTNEQGHWRIMYKRNKRTWYLIGGLLGVAAIAYAGLLLQTLQKMLRTNVNSSATVSAYARTETTYPVETSNLPAVGDQNAQLVIVEFSDYANHQSNAGEELLRQTISLYGQRIRLLHRDLPAANNSWSSTLAEAARCANDQGKFWIMHDRLFLRTDITDRATLDELAGEIDLNVSTMNKCLDTHVHHAEVAADVAAAKELGLPIAPAYFYNGIMKIGAVTPDNLTVILDSLFPDMKDFRNSLTNQPSDAVNATNQTQSS